ERELAALAADLLDEALDRAIAAEALVREAGEGEFRELHVAAVIGREADPRAALPGQTLEVVAAEAREEKARRQSRRGSGRGLGLRPPAVLAVLHDTGAGEAV